MAKEKGIGKGKNVSKGTKGFVETAPAKPTVPTAKVVVSKRGEKKDPKVVVAELEKAFEEVDAAAEAGDKKAIAKYDKARQKLDDALIALLPQAIANLKIGDRIDHTYLISGNPEWEGVRAEAKLGDSLVTEELLVKLRKGSFGQEPETPGDPVLLFTLLKVEPAEAEEEEIALSNVIDAKIEEWTKPRGVSSEHFNVPTDLEREWHSNHSIDDSHRNDCRMCGGKGLSEEELTEAIAKRSSGGDGQRVAKMETNYLEALHNLKLYGVGSVRLDDLKYVAKSYASTKEGQRKISSDMMGYEESEDPETIALYSALQSVLNEARLDYPKIAKEIEAENTEAREHQARTAKMISDLTFTVEIGFPDSEDD